MAVGIGFGEIEIKGERGFGSEEIYEVVKFYKI